MRFLWIKKRGIPIVSKCWCCRTAQEESIEHLFLQSEIAVTVWRYFAEVFQKTHHFKSILQLINIWKHGTSTRSLVGITVLGVFFYGIWEIWKHRCQAMFENVQMNAHQIIRLVLQHVQFLGLLSNPKRDSTFWEVNILEQLRIPNRQAVRRKGCWLKWNKPNPGHYK